MEKVKVIGSRLYQWELGRVISITPPDNTVVSTVEFAHTFDKEALAVMPREENGVIVADIPNILLQSGDPIFVFLVYVDANCLETTASHVLSVVKRPKPADYVYTETEVLTWEALDKRIEVVEETVADLDWLPIIKETPIFEEVTVNATEEWDNGATVSYTAEVWLEEKPNIHNGQQIAVYVDGERAEMLVYGNDLDGYGIGTDTWGIAVLGRRLVFYFLEKGEHTVAIYGEEYNKLPAEFLPDDIVDDEAVASAVNKYMAEHPIEETDPTVPAWAKAESKPTYTAQEVGALPADTKIPTALIVTVTNGKASHTPAEIYAHAQTGVVYLEHMNLRFWLRFYNESVCYFVTTAGNTSMKATVGEDGSFDVETTRLATTAQIPTDTHINSLIDTKIAEIPQGGGGGSSEMQEIFRLTTTEEVGMIETGIDLSQYAEVVAMCKTLPIEGTTANTHFDWYVSKGYAQRINNSLHNTQKRIQVAHITRLSSKKAICRLGYGTAQGSLFAENTALSSADNSAEIDEGRHIRIALDNLNNNFKFGSYGGKTPLIIGTEVLIYGRK